MEEAARIIPMFFFEVIVPLLGVENTTILGITTPMGTQNFYHKLLQLRGSKGEKIFRTLVIERICAKCKLTDHPELCTHLLSQNPSWKPADAAEKVMRIMECAPELLAREVGGVGDAYRKSDFDIVAINNWAARPGYPSLRHAAKHFIIALDPTGGGEHSEIGITCGFLDPVSNVFVVCGAHGELLSRSSPYEHNRRVITEFIKNMYKHCSEAVTATTIVTIVEAQMSRVQAVDEMAIIKACCQTVSRTGQSFVQMHNEKGEPGVSTTFSKKCEMVEVCRKFLDDGRLYFSQSFFCASPKEEERMEQRKKLLTQAAVFKLHVDEGRDPGFSAPRMSWHGKHEGPDDTFMSFLMLLYHTVQFFMRPEYAPFRR